MVISKDPFTPRLSQRFHTSIWCVWAAVAVAFTAPMVAFHFRYAREQHPAVFPVFVSALLLIAFVLPLLYQRFRRRWRRIEPALTAGFVLAVPLFYEPRATVVTLWLLVVFCGTGSLLLERLGLSPPTLSARWTFRVAGGLAVWVWPLAATGLAGLLQPWALLASLAAATLLVFRSIRALGGELRQAYRAWSETPDIGDTLPGWLLPMAAVLVAAGLAVCLTPSIAFDPLKFHLPLAQQYASTGRVAPLESDSYGFNPQNFEILLAAGYLLAGQFGAQLIAPAFYLVFLVALFAVARAVGVARGAAVTACALTAAIPYIHWTGVQMKNDCTVAFLHLAALLAWLEWRARGRFAWILLGVFFAAVSLGFKHPAAFGLLGLAPLYVYAAWRNPRRWQAFAGCAAVGLTFGSFWLVRSWVLTGDPFVYYAIAQPLPPEHGEQVGSLARRFFTALTWPYQAHFDGSLFFRSFTPNPLGVVLLMFLPGWLLWKRRNPSPGERACLVFAVGALLPWSFYVPLLRFVIAPISVLVILTAARLCASFAESRPPALAALFIATGWTVLTSVSIIAIIEVNAPQFRYFGGHIDKTGYLREALLTYRSMEALREYAGPNDTVFGVQNCSRAYAPYPGRFFCDYYHPEIPADRTQLRQALADLHCRYLILPTSNSRPEILTDLTGRYEALHTDEHYSLFRLGPP